MRRRISANLRAALRRTTPDTTQKNTSAFYLQAAVAFGVSLFSMMAAVYYLPADPWVRAFLALGTLIPGHLELHTRQCVRDAQEDQMVVRRLDRARLDRALATTTPSRTPADPASAHNPERALARSRSRRPRRRRGIGQVHVGGRRYRRAEVVSSDDLRGVVGSGPADLDASADAFDLLERIVAARVGRGLTTVVDTLGLDADRRTAWLDAARAAGLPAVVVVLDTPGEECRRRNAERDRPVPAAVLAGQVDASPRRRRRAGLAAEGWDHVEVVSLGLPPLPAVRSPTAGDRRPAAVGDRHRVTLSARRPAGGAAAVPVPLGRGPGWVGARRWRWRPTRPGSPGWR